MSPISPIQFIDELVDLLNILPRPLKMDCILSSLKRLLYINATSPILSAQPENASNPRIFIFKGDFIISFVPDGEGAKILEFNQITSSTRSIKGELSTCC